MLASKAWWRMVYPRNYDRAFECFVRDLLGGGEVRAFDAKDDDVLNVPALWVKAMILGMPLKELKPEIEIQVRKGVTAGRYLVVAHASRSLGRKIVFNRCAAVLNKFSLLEPDKRLLQAKPYGNKPEIQASWKEMQPVAHLWAATIAIDALAESGALRRDPNTLIHIFRLASAFGRWGISEVSGGSPLLDPESHWMIPESFPPLELTQRETGAVAPWIERILTGPQKR